MGTFRISNFTADAIRLLWVDHNFGWDIEPPNAHTPFLSYQPSSSPPSPAGGEVHVRLSANYASLYLDGSSTPTALEDLPEDFGIDTITYEQTPPWLTTGVLPGITPNMPLCNEPGTPVLRGGGSQYYWTIEPVGLDEYQLPSSGLVQSNILLADPELGVGYPPVFTKWNGFLQSLLQQGTLRVVFSRMPVAFGAYELYTFVDLINSVNEEGYLNVGELWGIEGTYGSYPPPPNPTVYMGGGLDFGSAPIIQILSDASGIYTLTAGLHRDELWQRSGTTATVVSFEIPQPFFKTGYIGGR
jgi:hypothetical protein